MAKSARPVFIAGAVACALLGVVAWQVMKKDPKPTPRSGGGEVVSPDPEITPPPLLTDAAVALAPPIDATPDLLRMGRAPEVPPPTADAAVLSPQMVAAYKTTRLKADALFHNENKDLVRAAKKATGAMRETAETLAVGQLTHDQALAKMKEIDQELQAAIDAARPH